jgi:DNA-binding HxlR family transcriptional regulator
METASEIDQGVISSCGKHSSPEGIAGIRDALYVLNGKWKFPLIFAMSEGPMRFKDIQRSLGEITPKILSKELKELEINEFIVRKVFSTKPVTVTYELTPYSLTLDSVLRELRDWGIAHRKHLVASRRSK